MGIAVIGPLTIEGDHKELGRRDRVVLAALAVHPGDVVSAEETVMAKAQGFVAEAPLRERRWVLLATAQYQAGRQGEVFGQRPERRS